VPPPLLPLEGDIEATTTGFRYWNATELLVKSAPPLVDTSRVVEVTCEEGGAAHSREVADKSVASTGDPELPKRQRGAAASSEKPEPVTVTTVPPATEPLEGLIEDTDGLNVNSKSTSSTLKSTPLLLTDTETDVGSTEEEAGEAHTISLELTNPAATSVDPKRHCKSLLNSKSLPVKVTVVPPVKGPVVGDRADTEGLAP
jgi:hypothetical protein